MKRISIVVPVYNEEKNIQAFYQALLTEFKESLAGYDFELLFINDGSKDNSHTEILKLAAQDARVRPIEFTRNFGKEIATTAGINFATGEALIMIDVDLQHPVERIKDLLSAWEKGAEVVVGVRKESKSDSTFKRVSSIVYYKIINMISETQITPHATDFRLIDRVVIEEFNRLTERNRITRGLIDWLGFRQELVYFDANERFAGEASYSVKKLITLFLHSIMSHSLFPLRLAIYLGFIIICVSGFLGVIQFLDRYFLLFGLDFTGTAILANITIFLVGVIIAMLGIIAVYLGNVHQESQARPLYVVRNRKA